MAITLSILLTLGASFGSTPWNIQVFTNTTDLAALAAPANVYKVMLVGNLDGGSLYFATNTVSGTNTTTRIASSLQPTWSWELIGSLSTTNSFVPTSRLINTTSPLTGGGDLSSDLTLSIPQATSVDDGYLAATDWIIFNNKQAALSFTNGVTNISDVVSADLAAGSNITFATNNGRITISGSSAGTTINPTDGVIPVRVNSTTFGDSSISTNGTNIVIAGDLSLNSQTNLLTMSGGFLKFDGVNVTTGSGGTVGTMINTTTTVVGQVPYATDTTKTNWAPSGALTLDASTNAALKGNITANGGAFTNTLTLGGISVATLNSLDTYIPYRSNSTNGNSPLYVISTNTLGFNDTANSGPFIYWNLDTENLFIGGKSPFLSSGQENTGLGANTLQNLTTGGNNTAVGDFAGVAITTGHENTTLGVSAGAAITTQSHNVAIGYESLFATTAADNVAVGYFSGVTNTTGSQNVLLGVNANAANATNSNEIVVGYNAIGHGPNTVTVGNSSATALYLGNTQITNGTGGGGGTVGTMINTTTTAVGTVPYATDTTKTNWAPSGSLTLDASTNAILKGNLTANGGAFTNSLTLGGTAVALSSTTISAGNGMSGGGDLSANRTLTLAPTAWTSSSFTIGDSSQASITFGFGLSGATDPVFTVGNNSMDLTTGVLKYGGNTVAVVGGNIGAATATTATAGDSSTLVATTALVSSTETATHASPSTTNPLSPTWTGPMHIVWYGATGTINLPAASGYAERGILVYNTGAFTITIDANGSEVIVRDGVVQTGGVSMLLSSGAGNYVALICDGVRWITVGFKGTLSVGT